jgi:hypothetical protein
LASYGDVARRLGVTQPRITQIMGLLFWSPEMQEEVLLCNGGLGIREGMKTVQEVEWMRRIHKPPRWRSPEL